MPAHRWWFEFNDFGAVVNAWSDKEAGALLAWSMWTVDSLYYLVDLDDRVFGDPVRPTGGHEEDVVNVGHVRWACGSAITAIDLCAATIWRLATSVPASSKERNLRDFDLNAARSSARKQQIIAGRSGVNPAHLDWIDAVLADPDYTAIIDVRHPLTHARLPQVIRSGRAHRTGFIVGPTRAQFEARDLIEGAVRVATSHVEGFFDRFIVPRPAP